MPLIEHPRLHRLYRAVAVAHGASPNEAETFAACLVRADVRGYTRQGVAILPYYHELLGAGVVAFGKEPEVEREGPAFAVMDGHRNVGQVIGTRAMAVAREKARESGIGIVTVHDGGDFAMASCFAMQALEEDQIGIAMGNGFPIVAPWGGRDPFFCTNPIAMAVPTGEEAPLVIDMATSSYSMGQIVRAARDGRTLGPQSVVDPEGRYGDDPSSIVVDAMNRESQLDGAILPAGPKGNGWLLIVEVLSGVLSGSLGSYSNARAQGPGRDMRYGHCFIAIDVEQLLGLQRFRSDIDAFIAALRRARPASDFDAVRVPGSRAAAEERKRLADGVPVRDEEWEMALRIGRVIGLDPKR